jgi:hypothetical protein
MNLRGLRSIEGALALASQLGYDAPALPLDVTVLGASGEAVRLRSDTSLSRGYGLVIGSLAEPPRSLRTVGRRLVKSVHDQPLAILARVTPDRRVHRPRGHRPP